MFFFLRRQQCFPSHVGVGVLSSARFCGQVLEFFGRTGIPVKSEGTCAETRRNQVEAKNVVIKMITA